MQKSSKPADRAAVIDAASPSIRVLAPEVSARIAAGEVVERPASVVKELVENSLDAGTRRVQVDIEGGGIDRITVADDGVGIRSAELATAFERHATSKLRSDVQLTAIQTLGFRGEALPSIAAVASVRCSSRTTDSAMAARLSVEYGAPSAVDYAARTIGTTIEVADLFLRTPARRKFLRGRPAETAAIVQVVEQLALARPDVAFTLRVDEREIFASAGDGELRRVAATVWGLNDPSRCIPVDATDTHAGVRVWGVLAPAELHRPTRTGLTFIVNGRWVQSRPLGFAAEEACKTWTPTGRFPVAVLQIELAPAEVDVNVHPRKTEVRFLRERAVFNTVQRAVREAVLAVQSAEVAHGLGHDDDEHTREVRVLGQAASTYIIAEGAHGLYLVDQHAAHERVLLEEILDGAREQQVQWLMEPTIVPLVGQLATAPDETIAALGELGYQAELFGRESLLVRTVPAPLVARQPLRALADALDELSTRPSVTDWRHLLAVRLACHSAVRAGDSLATTEMQALIRRLGEAELCGACAHGRPTAILITHEDLERQFGRR